MARIDDRNPVHAGVLQKPGARGVSMIVTSDCALTSVRGAAL
jgi:hypothetical protein